MTDLVQGDIAVIYYSSDSRFQVDGTNVGTGFHFVVLRDMDDTRPVFFTTNSMNTAGENETDEWTWRWDPPSGGVTAGTVVTFTDTSGSAVPTSLPDTVSHGTMTVEQSDASSAPSTVGDQIFVYQNAGDTAVTAIGGAPSNLLFGMGMSDADSAGSATADGWNGSLGDDSNSQLPAALSGANVGFTTDSGEPDNAFYDIASNTGSAGDIFADILDEANWTTSGAWVAAPTYSFSVAGAAPTLDTNAGLTLDEGATADITAALLETNDADTADSELTYTLDSAPANGTLWVDADNSGTINGGEAGLAGGGTFSQADIAAGRLTYAHDGSETTSDGFQFDVSDGATSIDNQTFSITVDPVNDVPVITNLDFDSITYFESFNGAPAALQPVDDVRIIDPDDPTLDGGQLVFAWRDGGLAEDQLSLPNEGFAAGQVGLSGTTVGSNVFVSGVQIGTLASTGENGTDLTVDLNANATLALTETLIHKSQYANSAGDDPAPGERFVQITVSDGTDTSGLNFIGVTVVAENDAPVLSVPTDIGGLTEGAEATLDLSGISVADPDSSVRLRLVVDQGSFTTVTDDPDVSEVLVDPQTLLLSGSDAELNAYLAAGNIGYTGATGVSGDNAAALTINASDMIVTTADETINLDIMAANQPPVAQDDAVSTDEATVLSGDVLADNGNGPDADAESDPITVTEVNGASADIGAQITLGTGALLTLRADGTFDYDPNGFFNELPAAASGAANPQATDSFTYTVNGGDTATVTVTVTGLDSDDLVTGGPTSDSLLGGIGADTLQGLDGSDTLEGGPGPDSLEGGIGSDQASYANSPEAVNVSLSTGYAAGGDALGDVFDGIEGFIGSAFDDILNGAADGDTLSGGDGNDILRGRGGADVLEGGGGSDTADYVDSSSFVSVNLATGDTSGGGGGNDAQGDTFDSIENLTGSRFGDVLTGDGNANVLRGWFGADTLDGGGGTDTASYEGARGFVNVSLETGFAGGGAGSTAIGDSWISIENLIGSDFDDRLNGDDNANVLQGGDGDDQLRGRGGSDALEGGEGNDTADYRDSDSFVSINLATGDTSGGGAGNDAEGDLYASIENLTGTGFDDSLTGDTGDNVLEGYFGGDALDGGDGSDTAAYRFSSNWVNVSLQSGFVGGGAGSHALGDTFTSIENLFGSSFGDRLNGDNGANVLTGWLGDDTLRGNDGADTFVFADGFGADMILDFQDGSDVLDFTAHSASGFGDLTVTESGADALVEDGAGNSITLTGAAGQIGADDFLF